MTTQQTIAAKNSARASAGLRVLHYYNKISKDKDDAVAADRGNHVTHARDYAHLVSAFDEAEAAHVDYLLLTGRMPGDGNEHDAWLSGLREKVEAIDEPPNLQPAITGAAMAIAMEMEAVGADVDARLARLKESCGEGLAEKTRVVIKRLLAECSQTRTQVQDSYVKLSSQYVVMLPPAIQAETSTKVKGAVAAWSVDIANCQAACVTLLTESPVQERAQVDPVPNAAQVAPVPVPCNSGTGTRAKILPKLETIKVKWDGRAQSYYRFKKSFGEIVEPAATGIARYEYLISGLPQSVQDDLVTYSSDAAEVWRQLDDLYGRSAIQLEAALDQLRQVATDASIDDMKRMKRLNITLQSITATLREQGQECEIRTETFNKALCSMLPRHEISEYSIRYARGQLAGVTKFDKLVTYLQHRAEEIRQSEEIVANPGVANFGSFSSHATRVASGPPAAPASSSMPGGVGYASGAGQAAQPKPQVPAEHQQHQQDTSTLPPKVPGRSYPASRREPRCPNCNKTGHDFSLEGCPEPIRKCVNCGRYGHEAGTCRKKKRGAEGVAGGRPDKRQPEHSIETNELRVNKCWRCKNIADQSTKPCSGCNSSKPNHCLFHCEAYQAADLSGRVSMVKRGEHCPCCLALGHTWEECKQKEKPDNRCGLGGCTKRHHLSLHSSTDPYVVRCNATSLAEPGSFTDVFLRSTRASPVPLFHHEQHAVDTAVTKERRRQLAEMKDFSVTEPTAPPTVLMMMITAAVLYGAAALRSTVVMFMDTGSTCSIIRHATAKRLDLFGKPITVWIKTVNGQKKLDTLLYWLEVLDRAGRRQSVLCLGMDTITSPVIQVSLEKIKDDFPAKIQSRWSELEARPVGEVDVLLGADYAGYFPSYTLARSDHLLVAESPLTGELVAWGTHPQVEVPAATWDPDVLALRSVQLVNFTDQIHRAGSETPLRMSVDYEVHNLDQLSRRRTPCYKSPPAAPAVVAAPVGEPDPDYIDPLPFAGVNLISEADFLRSQEVGVEPPRRCPRCRGCQDCSFRGLRVSEREEAELELIQSNVKFDAANKEFQVSFPWLVDPAGLEDNYGQALAIARQWERKYKKLDTTETANATFRGMLEQGMVRKISTSELASWDGPVHYVAVQGVQSASVSTPLRLVTNTSLRGRNGLSPNDAMAKGPDMLGDAFSIFQRFRTYEQACLSDVSKCYHRLRTGLLEMHVRRVLWRFSESEPWVVYGLCCVSFGDRCASAVLEVVLRMCVDMFGQQDPEAGWKIVHDRFVDDWHSGGTEEQVRRFLGDEDENWKRDGTVPQIFEAGGLVLKCMVRSGEPDGEKLAKLGGSVMGLSLSTARDELAVPFVFNFTKKKSRLPTGPNLSLDNLDATLSETKLTRRMVMGATAGIFDPYGWACPVTIVMRAAVRRLFTPELDWDTAIPELEQLLWAEIIRDLVRAARMVMPRRCRPAESEEVYVLVFWDASQDACATVIYLVWVVGLGHEVFLLVAKNKLAPSGMMSVPRLELIAAVMASRISLKVVTALQYLNLNIRAVLHVGDSETVLAALEKSSGFFSDFYSNRILEVRENMRELSKLATVEPWQHVPGERNPADRPSRLDSTSLHLLPDSEWVRGPDYLRLPRSEWGFNRNFADRKSEPEFPATELSKKLFGQVNSTEVLLSCLHLSDAPAIAPPASAESAGTDWVAEHFQHGHRTNSWARLIGATAKLFEFGAKTSKLLRLPRQGARPGLTCHQSSAERYWLLQATPATLDARQAGKLRSLTTYEEDGLVMVKGRAGAGLRAAFQRDALPVIMSCTRVAFLIVLAAHEKQHCGRDLTLHLASQTAWIVGGRRLATTIKVNCVRCKYLEHRLEGQMMAPLPELLTVPCPPFTNIGIDFAGFFMVTTGLRNTRLHPGVASKKVWALLIGCLNTKAISILVVPGYDTDSLVLALHSHVAERGAPVWVHSDRGSQMTKAAKEVNENGECPEWDYDSVRRGLGTTKTQWTVCPAGSQWRNGSLEAAVKKLKKSLALTYTGQVLNILEMQLAFRRAASLFNSRPVYAQSQPGPTADSEVLSAVTPNHLLLGRACPEVVHRDWDMLAGPHSRLNMVLDLETAWWKQWSTQCLPGLVPTPRWRQERRPVVPGDIVLLQYSGKIHDEFKLGRVMLTEPGRDGLTRTVVLRYSATRAKQGVTASQAKVSPKYIRTPVQRLCVILPAEFQSPPPTVSPTEAAAALAGAGEPPLQPPLPSDRARSPVPPPHPSLPAETDLARDGEDGGSRPAIVGGGSQYGPGPRSHGGALPDPTAAPANTGKHSSSGARKSRNCSRAPNPRQPHASRSPPRTRAQARAARTGSANYMSYSSFFTSRLLENRSRYELDHLQALHASIRHQESVLGPRPPK